jgi:hypothetical protein
VLWQTEEPATSHRGIEYRRYLFCAKTTSVKRFEARRVLDIGKQSGRMKHVESEKHSALDLAQVLSGRLLEVLEPWTARLGVSMAQCELDAAGMGHAAQGSVTRQQCFLVFCLLGRRDVHGGRH